MSDQYQDNPYVGPRPFTYGETLYGRDREKIELLDLLIAERILMLYSPSGAGKSSLVEAALTPALEEEDFDVLPIIRVNRSAPPGTELPENVNRYVLSLLLSLEEIIPEDRQMDARKIADLDVDTYLKMRRKDICQHDSAVLIFDQFEEIITMDPTDRARKTEFFAQIGKVLRARDLWSVFALREDFVAGLDPFLRSIPTRLATTFRLELLNKDSARDAMQKPAKNKGRNFTDAAANKLVGDLCSIQVQEMDGKFVYQSGLYVEPMQLQVVCQRLWEKMPQKNTEIVEKDIETIGDVDRALSDYYSERLQIISQSTGLQERKIRDWCNRQLITEQGIRGQVLKGEKQTEGLENTAIQAMVDAHLIRSENRGGRTWYELAHDRLVKPVKDNNAEWIEKNLTRLQRQSSLWEKQSMPDGLLLQGDDLAEAENWAEDHSDDITQTEKDFLEKSKDKQETIDREKKQVRRIKWLAVVSVILMACALSFAYWAKLSQDEAERQTLRADEKLIEAQHNLGLVFSEKADTALKNKNFNVARLYALHALDSYNPKQKGTDKAKIAGIVLSYPDYPIIFSWPKDFYYSVNSVSFSSNGRILASGASDNIIYLWDVETGKEKSRLSGHTDFVRSVEFSPDGKTLASGSNDNTIRLWNVETGKLNFLLSGHKLMVYSVGFSPDGKTLASGSDDTTIRLWDVANGKFKKLLKGHNDGVSCVSFSPDGTLISVSLDRTVRLWNMETGKNVVLNGDDNRIHTWNSLALSPNGKILAAGSSLNTIRLWNLTNRKIIGDLPSKGVHINSMTFFPDSKILASGSSDKIIQLWNVESGEELAVLSGHTGAVTDVNLSHNGRTLVSSSTDGTIRLWDMAGAQEKHVLKEHEEPVFGLSFSPDGNTLATGSYDKTIRLWDIDTNQELFVLTGHTDAIFCLNFSPDGKTLVSGSWDNTIRVWDVKRGEEKDILTGHTDFIKNLVFSQDGKTLASASYDNTIRIWDTANYKLKTVLTGHTDNVLGLGFSPDGNILVSSSYDKTIRFWDIKSGNAKKVLSNNHIVWDLKFSPISNMLALASDDHSIRLMDAQSYEIISIMKEHNNIVWSVNFSPDGNMLASGSGDNTLRLWNVKTGEEIAVITGHSEPVTNVCFLSNNKLASTSEDNTLRIWDLSFLDILKDNKLMKEKIQETEQIFNLKLIGLDIKLLDYKYNNLKPEQPKWPKSHPLHWLSKAESGDSESMIQSGLICERENEFDNALAWYKKLADAGHPYGIERLTVLKNRMNNRDIIKQSHDNDVIKLFDKPKSNCNEVINEKLLSISFDNLNNKQFDFLNGDPGIFTFLKRGVFIIEGKSTQPWATSGFSTCPITDYGAGVDTQIQFMWPNWKDGGLLFFSLEAQPVGSLMIMCQGRVKPYTGNGYIIQALRRLKSEYELKGKSQISLYGDEEYRYHKLRVRLRNDRTTVDFIVDDEIIGTLLLKSRVENVSKVTVGFQSGGKGGKYKLAMMIKGK